MKKLIPFVLGLVVLACNSEKDVDPANTGTFMRYYGSEHNHTAVMAMEADDGYTLLSNMDLATEVPGEFDHSFRVIHTDMHGNTIWHVEYPALDSLAATPNVSASVVASSFIRIDDGYLIVGTRINSDGSKSLHLRKIGFDGEELARKTISEPGISLEGRAVAQADNGTFIVLAARSGGPPDDMYLAKINGSNFTAPPIWEKRYGDGITTVANRLFVNSDATLFWAGSIKINNDTDEDMRWIIAAQNSDIPSGLNPNPFSGQDSDEKINDVSRISGRYAVTGTTRATTQSVYFTLLSGTGAVLLGPTTFSFADKNEEAASICSAHEGGYVIAATAETGGTSSGTRGNGQKDYWLFKVRATGSAEPEWQVNYGGSDDEVAACVVPTSDNSYLLFGTTSFDRLKKLMLMKVNSKGEL